MNETAPGLEISPWWGIWVQPRQTLRWLVDTNPKLHFWILAVFYGLVRVFSWSIQMGVGDIFQPAEVAVFMLVAGPLAGIFGIFVTAGLLQIIGRIFGGEAKGPQLRAVLAWAAVPMNVLTFVGVFPLLLMFGSQVFVPSDPQVAAILFGKGAAAGFLGSGLSAWWNILETVGALYYLVVAVIGYAEVQQFGTWKALGTFFIAVGGLMLVALCLALIGAPL